MKDWKIKGPWHFVKHNWEATSIYDADRETVCTINIHFDVTEETQDHFEAVTAAKADAIAALPDLIEAAENASEGMRNVVRQLARIGSEEDAFVSYEPLMEAQMTLRSALLKCKGGEE